LRDLEDRVVLWIRNDGLAVGTAVLWTRRAALIDVRPIFVYIEASVGVPDEVVRVTEAGGVQLELTLERHEIGCAIDVAHVEPGSHAADIRAQNGRAQVELRDAAPRVVGGTQVGVATL